MHALPCYSLCSPSTAGGATLKSNAAADASPPAALLTKSACQNSDMVGARTTVPRAPVERRLCAPPDRPKLSRWLLARGSRAVEERGAVAAGREDRTAGRSPHRGGEPTVAPTVSERVCAAVVVG